MERFPPPTDDLDREIEQLLREAEERSHPDRVPPRGNPKAEAADVDRSRRELERVLGC